LLLYLWIFSNVSPLYFIFPILFGKFNHIVKFEQVWKISHRVPLSRKICKIFFITIISSGIFLSSSRTSRLKIMRKIFTAHSSSVAEKAARFYCFLPGIPLIFLRILHFSSLRPDSEILTRLVIKTSEENSHRYSPPPELA